MTLLDWLALAIALAAANVGVWVLYNWLRDK